MERQDFSHVCEWALHELTEQHSSVAAGTKGETESNTSPFGMPAVVFTGAFFPTLVQCTSIGDGDGVNGEFLEFGNQTTAGPFA